MDYFENLMRDCPRAEISSMFSMEDCSSNMEKYFANICTEKKLSEIAFVLPTEVDPNQQDTMNYINENLEKIFTNIMKTK